MDKKIISQNILRLREREGWTQAELGERLYVSDKLVSKWERGESLPDADNIVKLAEMSKMSVGEFTENEKIYSAEPVGVPSKRRRLKYNAVSLIADIGIAALFRVKFRVENVPKFLGFGSECVRSAYNLKRVYLTAGSALCFATFLFEAAQFAGVAFIAVGLKPSTAVALRAAAIAAAVFVPYLYYRASLKRICGDEKIISRVTRSEKTIDF